MPPSIVADRERRPIQTILSLSSNNFGAPLATRVLPETRWLSGPNLETRPINRFDVWASTATRFRVGRIQHR